MNYTKQNPVPLILAQNQVKERFAPGSPEWACMTLIVNSNLPDQYRCALLSVIVSPTLEKAIANLRNLRGVTSAAARATIMESMKLFATPLRDFEPLFTRCGFLYVESDGTWYPPRKEYEEDRNNVKNIQKDIPDLYQPVYKAAFELFMRSYSKTITLPERLSYVDLCQIGGLLLPGQKQRDDYIQSLRAEFTSQYDHYKRAVSSVDFIHDCCEKFGLPLPSHDLNAYIKAPTTRRGREKVTQKNISPEFKSGVVPPKDASCISAGNIEGVEREPTKTERLRAARLARDAALKAQEAQKVANGHPSADMFSKPAYSKESNGFDLARAKAFILAAKEAKVFPCSDRYIEVFLAYATDPSKNAAEVAAAKDTTPFGAKWMVSVVAGELRKAGLNPPCLP